MQSPLRHLNENKPIRDYQVQKYIHLMSLTLNEIDQLEEQMCSE